MHHQVYRRANSYAPPYLPHYQPHVLPSSGYNYQPCFNGFNPFVYQSMPQTPYFGAFGTWPYVEPFLSCHGPSFMPNIQSHFSGNSVASLIKKQTEYYFSDENLDKPDRYLISLMDDKGWVPVAAIAEFRRVKAMCKSVTFILESLLDSNVVEVQGNKIRRRGVWSRWISSAKLAA